AGVYTLTASNSCGSATPVNTASVTVNTIPTAVTASASPNPTCEGAVLTLTGGATGATAWSWTGPNAFTSTLQSPTIAGVTPAGAGVYTLTASNSCGSATPVNTASVTVNTIPTAVTASASPNPICAGAALTLTGGATGATTWSWTGPNSFTSSLQNPTITGVTPAGAGVYTLTASNSCGAATAVTTASVTVNLLPAAPTAGTNTPSQTQIIWNWNTVSGATGYKWNTTDNYASATATAPATYTQTGLTCNTAYTLYIWAYNACGASSAATLTQTTSACFVCGTSAVTDFDANTYNTVLIGSQCWMKENLKTTHYSDGTAMLDGTGAGNITGNYTSKYYFDYANTPANTVTYGKLYTYAAIMNGAASSNANPSGVQGVCPTGWHLPSDAEWNIMEKYLDSTVDTTAINWVGTDIGGKLKETGFTHWNSPNTGATNSSGFTALPGGDRYYNGTFTNVGNDGYWWSATQNDASNAWKRSVDYSTATVDRNNKSKAYGFSVRCLRDDCSTPSTPTQGTHTPSGNQIIWKWNKATGASGYKWSTTNSYGTAVDLGTDTAKTETGLTCNTSYTRYVWAYNACGASSVATLTQTTAACTAFVCGTDMVGDYDGNGYNTVQIGSQCWMKENLKTTHYANGTAMLDGTSAGDITGNYTSKYYFDYNNTPSNTVIYGKLYTWAAVMNGAVSSNANPSGVQGVCPTGWHLPSDAEWNILEKFLDNTVDTTATGWVGTDIGTKLKEAGTSHWASGNTGTNSSGFTALPGGSRSFNGTFYNIGIIGYWWSSKAYDSSYAWGRYLYFNNAHVYRDYVYESYGFSVRCLRD
ncbi:MAG: hypothetical protein HY958_03255, partial [Bacteroidia bacterium]|nr:hypothetical protein [Bacteroidia bacterium]